MNAAVLVEIGMIGSGIAYVIAAFGWYVDNKPWMAVTFACYALTAFTLYMQAKS